MTNEITKLFRETKKKKKKDNASNKYVDSSFQGFKCGITEITAPKINSFDSNSCEFIVSTRLISQKLFLLLTQKKKKKSKKKTQVLDY